MGLLTKQAAKYFPYVFEDWEHTLVKDYVTMANQNIPGFHINAKANEPGYQDEYLAELKRVSFHGFPIIAFSWC